METTSIDIKRIGSFNALRVTGVKEAKHPGIGYSQLTISPLDEEVLAPSLSSTSLPLGTIQVLQICGRNGNDINRYKEVRPLTLSECPGRKKPNTRVLDTANWP